MKLFYLSIFLFLFFSPLAIAKTNTLRIQTSENAYNGFLSRLGEWERIAPSYTNGEIEIDSFQKDVLIPVRNTSKAISLGSLAGDLIQVNQLLHLSPAFGLIEDLMAEKRSPKEVTHFCMKEGGRQILQDIHDQVYENVYVVGCGSYYRDSFILNTSLSETGSPEDLIVHAREGISKELFRLSGAVPIIKRYHYDMDVFYDLKDNRINIAPASIMRKYYFNRFKERSYIFNAYHLMPLYQFTISKKTWNSLSDKAKKGLTEWFEKVFYDLAENLSNPILDAEEVSLDKSIFRNFVLDTWKSLLEEKRRQSIKLAFWKKEDDEDSHEDIDFVIKTYEQYVLLEGEEELVKEQTSSILID